MIIKTRKHKIIASRTIFEIIRHILKAENQIDQDKEHLWTVGLDGRNRVKYIELVSLGTLTSSLAHPREIYRFAIIQGVASLIVCHNHPSGISLPSDEDIELTKRLKQVGDLIGIKLLDHVIISDHTFYSFADKGTL